MAEYYSPRAKKRWCLSLYENVGHHALGVFPQAAMVTYFSVLWLLCCFTARRLVCSIYIYLKKGLLCVIKFDLNSTSAVIC